MDGRILIIDDSPILIKTLLHILTGQGYSEVESCSDGESGWNRLVAGVEHKAPPPDLLLLDLNMPGLDGMALLNRIRADERFALLPVIILTAETDTEVRMLALEAGANDYLFKPVQTVELLARVKTILNWKLAGRLQQRRMEHLIEAGKILLSTHELESVLQRVMQIAVVELGAEGTTIWLRRPDDSLECQAAYGFGAERLFGKRIEPGQGIAGWVLQHKQSALVPDVHSDPRFYRKIDEQIVFQTHDLIAAPLVVRGNGIGVLESVNKQSGPFSPADLAWMEVLAPIAAAAIANAQLFQTLRHRTNQLQARNEELNAFAHTVAHDLKTPLATIVGYAETLTETFAGMSDEDLRRYLQKTAHSGRKMARIIDELLLLAGVGMMEVKISPLDMASIVDEALQRLAGRIQESQAEITVPKSWPVVLGYGPWVEEVWVNYISNAIKYGGRPPHIDLGFSTLDFGSDSLPGEDQAKIQNQKLKIKFWIRDNGPGLTPEAQAKLFVPFARLDRQRAEGHGLGLSIVQRIVEKLGGQVEVESTAGQGSTFSFTLASAVETATASAPLPLPST